MDIGLVFLRLWDFVALTAAPFILILGVMIFVHELGHYLAARYIGVRVLEFKLGFGRWIWKTQRGPTTYGVGVFPIGGYVKMFGDPTEVEGGKEEVAPEDIPESEKNEALHFKSTGRKLLVFFAGPLMNIALGFAIAPLIFMLGISQPRIPLRVGEVVPGSPAARAGILPGDTIQSVGGKDLSSSRDFSYSRLVKLEAINPGSRLEYTLLRNGEPITVSLVLDKGKDEPLGQSGIILASPPAQVVEVRPGSPAEAAGLAPGDLILAVNGKSVSPDMISWEVSPPLPGAAGGVSPDELSDILQKKVDLEISRRGQTLFVSMAPEYSEDHRRYLLGFQHSPQMEVIKLGVWDSIKAGAALGVESVVEVYAILWKLLTFQLSPKLMAGPLGIGAITSRAAHMGLASVLQLTVLIGINLGLLNLLPFPPLDGGHVVVTLVERVMGREINMKLKEGVFWAGFMLLITLMILVTLNDVSRFGPGILDFFKGLGEGLGL